MTAEEIAAAREWLTHYGPHLRTLDHDTRNAVRTADFCLARLEDNPESAAAAELEAAMTGLRAVLARRPVLPPLPEALTTGEFLPLPVLAQLGVQVYRRVHVPRVHSKFDVFARRRAR